MSGFELKTDPWLAPHWDQYGQWIQPSTSATSDMIVPYDDVIPQQLNYVYDNPMLLPYLVRYGGMPVVNPSSMEYIDDAAVFNAADTYTHPVPATNRESTRYAAEVFLQDGLPRVESRANPAVPLWTRRNGSGQSGLSEDKISERLHLETTEGKMSDELCSICLFEFEEKQRIGRLECRHGYHVECIKRWLLSKNVCPMCRSTAFTVL